MSAHKKYTKKHYSTQEIITGILAHNKVYLSKAITLLESSLENDKNQAKEIINTILPHTGKSLRLGITGIPGVGKSTFIETIGKEWLKENKKIAILAIDPSSQKTKGSILGDKTRMENLTMNTNVFIRPSAAGTELGGVHKKTRETILLCEAAGYDLIIVETVGVGQSEIAVHSMVDCFILLQLANAGDELQGIKKGIIEMADFIIINKIDTIDKQQLNNAINNYKNALHYYPTKENNWNTKILTSAYNDINKIKKINTEIKNYQFEMHKNNYWENNRKLQSIKWFIETIEQNLMQQFYSNTKNKNNIAKYKTEILENRITPHNAADEVFKKIE